MGRLRLWERAIVALAALKVGLAVSLFVVALATRSDRVEPRDALMIVHVVAFGAAAAMLLSGGRRDPRATLLGAMFILTAAVFGDNSLRAFADSDGPLIVAIRAVFALQVDAFTAYFLWRFVQVFPRIAAVGARYTLPQLVQRVAVAAGATLFVLNLVYSLSELSASWSSLREALVPVARKNASQANWYWIIQYALTLPVLPALLWKARAAPSDERRRVSLLVSGLVAGLAPTVLWVFLASISATVASRFSYAAWIIYPALLSTPFTTAYSVLVQEALDTRLIVRRAAQYALGRYALLAVVSIPILLLAIGLYQARDRSVRQLVAGRNGALLLLLVGLALVAIRRRRAAIETLDRRFFREQYDSRKLLSDLVERCRRTSSRAELAEILAGEIDRALHLSSIGVLFLDRAAGALVSTRLGIRPLDISSGIPTWLSESDGALDVDFERPSLGLSRLSDLDRHWLADTDTRLLIALKDPDRKLIGFVTLGEKKSELPFSDEDRLLLKTVASAAALSLAYLSVHPSLGDDRVDDLVLLAEENPAAECVACGSIDDLAVRVCVRCGSVMSQASVPRNLKGKFRLIERIGEGGMGVVYRALDLTLDRTVALKTLPRMSLSRAVRLRREARTIAAVSHPNLALIFGSESWSGVPILVFEFLAGGTLSDRLSSGTMLPSQAIALGITLAGVVGALHRAGIIHRDIKPSNIGFTADGTLKLLDFGVARLLSIDPQDQSATPEQQAGQSAAPNEPNRRIDPSVTDKRILGTPLYLSPEALAGGEPDPSFDLWGICLVIYEAMAGQNPARDVSPNKSMLRIETASFPDLRSFMPSVDPEIAAFFRRALAADRSERPQTARALRDELSKLAGSSQLPPGAA